MNLPPLIQPPKAKKAETIPERRIFMMGNGKPVQPRYVEKFCGVVMETLLDGDMHDHYEFALGFAACFDAVSRGTIGVDTPFETVVQAWHDVQNVTNKQNKITDLMRVING